MMQDHASTRSQDKQANEILLNIARTQRVSQREFDILVSYIHRLRRLTGSSHRTV